MRLYSESFPTYEAKKEADKQLFIDNLKKMGPVGVVRQIDVSWPILGYMVI